MTEAEKAHGMCSAVCITIICACVSFALLVGFIRMQLEMTMRHDLDQQQQIKQAEVLQQIISENPDALLLNTPLGDFVPGREPKTQYKFMPYENSWGAAYEWCEQPDSA